MCIDDEITCLLAHSAAWASPIGVADIRVRSFRTFERR